MKNEKDHMLVMPLRLQWLDSDAAGAVPTQALTTQIISTIIMVITLLMHWILILLMFIRINLSICGFLSLS